MFSPNQPGITGYYWREYNGTIPNDAVPGGRSTTGAITYIGQAFSRNKSCIIPATIYRNQSEVYFEQNGVNKADFVHILCSNPKATFNWLTVTSRNFHLQTSGHQLVRGGIEDGSIINIGRARYQGEVVVGKAISFKPTDAKLWFLQNHQGHSADSYEVLAFIRPVH